MKKLIIFILLIILLLVSCGKSEGEIKMEKNIYGYNKIVLIPSKLLGIAEKTFFKIRII